MRFRFTRNLCRLFAGFAAALLLLPLVVPAASASALQAPAAAEDEKETVATHAKAAALIDVESGRILYSHAGDKPMLIASLTKIMTAIVAIEHGNLSDMVKTSKRAAGKEGSSIYLRLGEEMSLHNMLYGLMLRSGNDAATAIAEHVGGSEEGFVHMMNEKAQMLGLSNSQFMNPSGLDAEGHYSSANDLARLTAYALKNPVFKEIVKTKEKKAPNPIEEWDYQWRNKNKMLAMYEGADGVKTGYTKKSLRTLVTSATRNGQQLVAVTLNDGDDWNDHRKLLDYGFRNYHLSEIAHKGQPINGYALAVGRTLRYPFAEGEKEQLRSRLTLLDARTTAYLLGERGSLEWFIGETKIGSTPVYEPQSQRIKLPEKPAWFIGDNRVRSAYSSLSSVSFRRALTVTLSTLFGGKEAGGW
ncbi:D-alanyl-D-alanine carboxypeptidase family protein [Paenibacillus montanisoli]|uniref:D-alanyl-D-alanine carboxypeptidase n=1 Tax=Paenibacillus montanisoli TaxID=2081970 RepID=A0A328U8K0_9BACL|nr:D-alanyl-D-alanine carboxypeptidase family protein [Paenibacillus montanisoli]RAP76434.1 D-alanyl-D-alanine carboxypeptidase [Paenibacillus montanisoli]